MAKILKANEIKTFQETGLLFPKRLLTTQEAAEYLAQLETYEAETGSPVNGKWRYKSNLVFPWVDRLMRNPEILDVV